MSSYASSASSRGSTPSGSPTRAMSIASRTSTSTHRPSFSYSASTTTNLADPYGSCVGYASRRSTDRPSAYISDADLFGDDSDEAWLSEPPPPPRQAEAWLARPLLPPVVAVKPRSCRTEPKKKRRSSSGTSKKE
ncbi:hypothetical protein CKM354_000512500 [Cercospora kikuchii]|uniref:Uncharacterized protein n=1 Tax=Cercospora kikuchii TaxID=84275 RepID=A0A9P3FGU4_9PEZI|nr:uncharacterized protein CKM354_000512500 [Cercospora kikuchii]GIZ41835.1 hypothetical protein CKM354_000512500 [Cercospora kikuchii]